MSATKSKNITWSHSLVSPDERHKLLGHGAATLWFTGLSGSGKSTIALQIEKKLVERTSRGFAITALGIDEARNSRQRLSRDRLLPEHTERTRDDGPRLPLGTGGDLSSEVL